MLTKIKRTRLTPGVYQGYVEEITESRAQNGTKFLTLHFILEDDKRKTYRLDKNFVRNSDKNFKLVNFLEELEILEDDGTVELDEIKDFDFNVTVSADPVGKLYISDLSPIWDEEGGEEQEEVEDIDFEED